MISSPITLPKQSERPNSIERDHKAARVFTNDISLVFLRIYIFNKLKVIRKDATGEHYNTTRSVLQHKFVGAISL